VAKDDVLDELLAELKAKQARNRARLEALQALGIAIDATEFAFECLQCRQYWSVVTQDISPPHNCLRCGRAGLLRGRHTVTLMEDEDGIGS
jgi:hypothetical protein